MANRIKGITIEIDGNTEKLSKSLRGLDQDIKETKSQLKDVEKLLKLDPGNVDLLKQKQQLLGDAVESTKERLDALNNAMKQMESSGVDKTSSEYMALQREIVYTENSLKDLEQASKETTNALNKISDVTSKISEGAEKVAKSTGKLSASAAAGLTGLVSMGIKAASSADDLNTLAKQTGFTTDTLQRFEYASDRIDVSMSDLTGTLKKLKKAMSQDLGNPDVVWEKFDVAITDANGDLRNIEDVFFEIVDALGQVENEMDRDALAMEVFGTNADALAGILDDGGKALRELGEEADARGLIISEEELATANELNDIIDELKATFTGSLGKAAVQVATALIPLAEKVSSVLIKISEIIASLSPQTVEIIGIVLTVVAAISPVAGIISKVASTISVIMPLLSGLFTLIAANPIVLVIGAIVAAIALLVANWDTIKEKATELWSHITETFNSIKENVVGKFNDIKENVVGKFNEIKENAQEKWESVKESISGAVGAAKDTVKEKLGNMKKAFEENGGGIKGATAAAWEGIKGYYTAGFTFVDKLTGGKLTEIKEAFMNKFHEIIESAKTWGKDIIDNLVGGIMEKVEHVKDAVKKVAQTIKDFLGFSEPDKGPLSNFHTFMPDMIKLMSQGLEQGARQLENPLGVLAQKLVPDPIYNFDYNDQAVTSRLDAINRSVSNKAAVQVNVALEGDARGMFRKIRTVARDIENETGLNPLI